MASDKPRPNGPQGGMKSQSPQSPVKSGKPKDRTPKNSQLTKPTTGTPTRGTGTTAKKVK